MTHYYLEVRGGWREVEKVPDSKMFHSARVGVKWVVRDIHRNEYHTVAESRLTRVVPRSEWEGKQ